MPYALFDYNGTICQVFFNHREKQFKSKCDLLTTMTAYVQKTALENVNQNAKFQSGVGNMVHCIETVQ